MDMNQFMQHGVDLQARQTVALESIALSLGILSGRAVTGETKALVTPGTTKVTPADTELEEANAIARQSALDAQKAEVAKSAAAAKAKAKALADASAAEKAELDRLQAAAEADVTTITTGKAPSIDDVRSALKGYAAIEGNPAAMKMLADFDAKSVSELGADKYADFIAKCQ